MFIRFIAAWLIMSGLQACTSKQTSSAFPRVSELQQAAPMAAKKPHQSQYHGLTLVDEYHWLKDPNYPEVTDPNILDYLKAENDYYAQFLAPHEQLVERLFSEFKSRINDTDTSVPFTKNGYEYRWFFQEGQDYRTWTRRKLGSQQQEVFLDEPKLAQDFDYFVLYEWDISPNNRYLAYSIDVDGSERKVIKIKDLTTNQYLDDVLTDAAGELAFSQDSQSLIYASLDPDKWRTLSVNLHPLGRSQKADKVLITETDHSFGLGFYLTSSQEFLVLRSSDADRSEVAVLPMADLTAKPRFLSKREQNILLSVDHGNEGFYLLTNDTHVNFRLAKTLDTQLDKQHWQTLIAGSDTQYLQDFQVFKDFLVLEQSINAVQTITVLPLDGESYNIAFPEKVASVHLAYNPEFEQQHIRLNYESMITPDTVFDYDTQAKSLSVRKNRVIPAGYDKSQYQTERLMASARDGVLVPITLVYKKGLKKDASQPLYLYGYGAYASGLSPNFSVVRLSLLDRGFIYAYAHVRGGDELGYQWYLDGKLTKRTNTFNDFVDVAKFLVKGNYVAEGNISISGGSAGGELVGAAVIQAPDMWRSATLKVPFVDVLNTMLDASLPLTPPEWGEWGNPIQSQQAFELIKSYSPYDNIQKRDYPPMLVTGGLNDPRVTYWEPAKWTAKMRANKTDKNLLVMRMNMGAGHFANSGRYGQLKDIAEEYGFVLVAHQIKQ
ncbi:S9 family peptidase [Paraglaciecola aestuariivivens]